MAIATGTAIAIGALASGAGTAYAANASTRATRQVAARQTQQANYAADLEAQAAERALAFARDQEVARQREFQMVQDRNRALYDAEQALEQRRYGDLQALEQRRYGDLQARMQPYRRAAVGSLGQLMRPAGTPRPGAGSLGARSGASQHRRDGIVFETRRHIGTRPPFDKPRKYPHHDSDSK